MKRKQNDVFGEDEQWAREGGFWERARLGKEVDAKLEATGLSVEGRGCLNSALKAKWVKCESDGEGVRLSLWARLQPFASTSSRRSLSPSLGTHSDT